MTQNLIPAQPVSLRFPLAQRLRPGWGSLVQLLVCAVTLPVSAQLVLDANYPPASQNTGVPIMQSLNLAQTFTVTQSGYLSRADLLVWWNSGFTPQNPLTLTVRTVSGGVPSEPDSGPNILATSAVPYFSLATAPAWTAFSFAPVPVSAGQVLALTLSSVDYGQEYGWAGDVFAGLTAGSYSGGQGFDRGISADRAPGDSTPYYRWGNMYFSGSCAGPLSDFGFRTYLTPVPEPSILALVLLGGVGPLALRGLRSA